MSRPVAVVLYLLVTAAVIGYADFAFFRRNLRWAAMALIGWVIGGAALAVLLQHYTDKPRDPEQQRRAQELIRMGRGILDDEQTIILVRVVKLADVHPDARYPSLTLPYATLLVLKSWKGPFSAGRVLHDQQPIIVCGIVTNCDYQFQARDNELLIFTNSTQEPIVAGSCCVWPAAEAQALMRALDQAVKRNSARNAQRRELGEGFTTPSPAAAEW